MNTSVPYLARLARQVTDPAAASGQRPALRPPRRLFSGAGLMDGLRGLGDPDTLAGPGLRRRPWAVPARRAGVRHRLALRRRQRPATAGHCRRRACDRTLAAS